SSTTATGILTGKGVVLGLAALVVVGGATVGYWWSRSPTPTRAAVLAPTASAPASATIAPSFESHEPPAPKSDPAPAETSEKLPPRTNRSRPAPAPRTAAVKVVPPEPGPNVAGEIAVLDEAQRALASGHPE